MELSITTPALLFPAITLLMLAYTNRFLALASLIRKLHDEYMKEESTILKRQISNLHVRIRMIRNMQAFGVLSFLLCVICMYLVFSGNQMAAHGVFAASLLSLLLSLIFSLIEIWKSTRALDLELSDMELKRQNIIRHIWEDTVSGEERGE
ncbi:MAG TPA: DUF2721 domain-containing protein [Lacibacter sp.]|nr:DUF2721 domain-containing protein [Lacibacter sp.]HMO87941.1 DUF2721 domain-containing protein [Lacibacter sp.]HMP86248.1 DUF2721 domain-containing protein [Lacibacter sp.]